VVHEAAELLDEDRRLEVRCGWNQELTGNTQGFAINELSC
jgi:hypothetical protein